MSEHTEQQTTTTITPSKGAEVIMTQEAEVTTLTWSEGLARTAYSAGKTISLGDYQFARFSVTIEVEHTSSREDAAYDLTKLLAVEIAEQEAAAVKSEAREPKPFTTGNFGKYRISLEYGLTLKTGKFDSAKVDVSMTRLVTHDDFASSLADMRAKLSSRVMTEARTLKG
jgi:hypothetical protein